MAARSVPGKADRQGRIEWLLVFVPVKAIVKVVSVPGTRRIVGVEGFEKGEDEVGLLVRKFPFESDASTPYQGLNPEHALMMEEEDRK